MFGYCVPVIIIIEIYTSHFKKYMMQLLLIDFFNFYGKLHFTISLLLIFLMFEYALFSFHIGQIDGVLLVVVRCNDDCK